MSSNWPRRRGNHVTQEVLSPPTNGWVEAKIGHEEFLLLLDTLRKIAERATKGSAIDMALLNSEIGGAIQGYEVDRWVKAEVINKMTLHEILGPVGVVLAALRNDANSGVIFDALGDGDFFEGILRRDALIANLERLEARAPQHIPPKKPNHRAAGINLRCFIGHLANAWLVLTNSRFSSYWIDEHPASLSTQFVHAVVKVLDPSIFAPTSHRDTLGG